MIIDAHAHFVPPGFLDEVASGRRGFSSVKVAVEDGNANNDSKRPLPPA